MDLCVIDKRLPGEAKENLSRMFDLVEFSTEGLTYEAISGHPDIFFCKTKDSLVVSPNIPEEYKGILRRKKIPYVQGYNSVNAVYPGSALYSAVVADNFIIHRMDITDPAITDKCSGLEKISVMQGYTRCSLLPLKDNSFITSDPAIYKKMNAMKLNIICVKPEGIVLPGFSHGFFGGTCGVNGDTVFITGSLDFYAEGRTVREFLNSLGYEIIELYEGPLFDGGSILFP